MKFAEYQTAGTSNFTRGNGMNTDVEKITCMLGKNKNALLKSFKECSTHSSFDGQARYVSFEQAKKALQPVLKSNLPRMHVTDGMIASILEPGIVQKQFSSNRPVVAPAFGEGYYEERPAKHNLYEANLYDFERLL